MEPTRYARIGTLTCSVAIGLLLAACGSDSPTGDTTTGRNSCPDVQGDVTAVSVSIGDWAGPSVEFDGRRTVYADTAFVSQDVTTPVVGPGDRVLVQVTFRQPLRYVSSDSWRILIYAYGRGGGWQGEAIDHPVLYNGNWTDLHSYFARCYAADTDYVLTGTQAWAEAMPERNEILYCLTFDYTIPATLNVGAAPKPGALPIDMVIWLALRDGDHTGEPSPVQVVR